MTSSQTPCFGVADSSFQAAGGTVGIAKLVDDFYDAMERLPQARTVRAMYPDELTLAREKLAAFLSGWLGGPRAYAQKFGAISIPQFHTRWAVGEDERSAWLDCMADAIGRQTYSAEFSAYLLQQLRVPAERILHAQPHRCPRGEV